MSIPLYFQAITIDKNGKHLTGKKARNMGEVMIDGGLISNYPIHIFDYKKYVDGSDDSIAIVNKETIGLRLDEDDQIVNDRNGDGLSPKEISNIRDYTFALYTMIIENLNRQQLTKDDWGRTIR